jgi:hypothetical protein
MRSLAAVALTLTVLTACSSHHPCTLVGAETGVSLEIDPPFAARVARASMTVCPGACRPADVDLFPATTASPAGSSDGTCGASAVRTGGMHGFGRVPALAKTPVRVSVVLWDAAGARVLDGGVTVTPKAVYPNGPHCGEAGPQARVVVAGGRLRSG